MWSIFLDKMNTFNLYFFLIRPFSTFSRCGPVNIDPGVALKNTFGILSVVDSNHNNFLHNCEHGKFTGNWNFSCCVNVGRRVSPFVGMVVDKLLIPQVTFCITLPGKIRSQYIFFQYNCFTSISSHTWNNFAHLH